MNALLKITVGFLSISLYLLVIFLLGVSTLLVRQEFTWQTCDISETMLTGLFVQVLSLCMLLTAWFVGDVLITKIKEYK